VLFTCSIHYFFNGNGFTGSTVLCLILEARPQFLGDDKNAVLMHIGVKIQI